MLLSLLDKALQAILKMLKKKDERVLLWKNASPTSVFKTQHLTIATSGYNRVIVEALAWNATSRCLQGVMHPVSGQNMCELMYIGNGMDKKYRRDFKIDADKKDIFISDAYYGGSTVDNTEIIPLAFYGVKSSGGGQTS